MVPLAQLATIHETRGPGRRSTARRCERRVLVEANVRGRDLVSYVNESRARVEARRSSCPQGYTLVWAGQFENFTRAKQPPG